MQPDAAQQRRRTVVLFLVVSGSLLAMGGVILSVAVEPLLIVVTAIGLIDLAFAALFQSGRMGAAPIASNPAGPTPEDPDDVAAEVTDDPSYKPYARED